MELLLQQYSKPDTLPGKVNFSTQQAIHFIASENIVDCKSNSNYFTLHFTDKTKMIASQTLKEVEDVLMHYHFYRVHHSFIINLRHISRYVKNDRGSIEMTDGSQVPISRQRKQEVMQVITHTLQ